MKYILLIMMIFLSACEPLETLRPKDGNIVKVHQQADSNIYRYENEEVICYIYEGYKAGGLSCKWKGKRK